MDLTQSKYETVVDYTEISRPQTTRNNLPAGQKGYMASTYSKQVKEPINPLYKKPDPLENKNKHLNLAANPMNTNGSSFIGVASSTTRHSMKMPNIFSNSKTMKMPKIPLTNTVDQEEMLLLKRQVKELTTNNQLVTKEREDYYNKL